MKHDAARIFYRIVLSPAPKQEDRYQDLNLRDLTLDTMLKLEERLGKPVQFVATLHDDHAPHRHVHTLVLVQGKRLTREDFQALRLEATERALSQRRLLDRIRGRHLKRTRSRKPPADPSSPASRQRPHATGGAPIPELHLFPVRLFTSPACLTPGVPLSRLRLENAPGPL